MVEKLSKEAKFSKLLLKDIDQVTKIGEGTFGQVYKAEFVDEEGIRQIIAIKKFRYFEKES